MANTTIKKRICPACDAEVRKGALFCFHCGGAVAPEVADSTANGDSVSSNWFNEKITGDEVVTGNEEKSKVTSKLDRKVAEVIDRPIEKPVDLPLEKPVDLPLEKPFEKPKPVEATKLKSAAEMRRKARTLQKNRVEEVVWEEYENAPNGWFLAAAFILILLAAGIYFLAAYLK